ncbi:MAG: hypothetical protein ACFFDT_21765 [Candidatus Hodarchaeota archaeon]
MTDTEETFEIWVKNGGTAYNPQLLLVMTKTCYDDLNQVLIEFEGIALSPPLDKGDFKSAASGFVPPTYPEGIRYTVASLKYHLGIEGSPDPIYWELVDFPGSPTINGPTDKYEVHITLDSPYPCMLVYVYAKSDPGLEDYDMKVPPTNPGFMVPEPATIAAVATPTLTLLAYALYKRKPIFS